MNFIKLRLDRECDEPHKSVYINLDNVLSIDASPMNGLTRIWFGDADHITVEESLKTVTDIIKRMQKDWPR